MDQSAKMGGACGDRGEHNRHAAGFGRGHRSSRVSRRVSLFWLGKNGKITFLSGMVPMEHEYKLMGLAPYAERAKEAHAISNQIEKLFAFDERAPLTWTRTNGCPPLAFGAEYLSNLLKRKRFDHIA